MLGLKRHTVEIVAHDPGWALLAVDTCQAVWRACGELIVDVQHVGSTAVPDPPAKPVLDIAVAVATFDSMPELAERLTRIDYFYRGDHGDAGGYLFVAESSPDIRTTHVHVVEHSGEQWRNYLLFRDLLWNSPATRKRYAELKKELAPICRHDRGAYTAAKADFIRVILENDVGRKPKLSRFAPR